MEAATKFFFIATRWLFILCLPVLLLTASLGIMVNSQWLYEYGFDKYNISQNTGLADSELEKVANGLVDYFNSNEDLVYLTVIKDGQPLALFNEREVAHIKDVKGLIWLDYRVLLGTGIYVLIYTFISICWLTKERLRQLAGAAVGGSGFTLGLILVLGIFALLDFDSFFLQFHLISFANDLWQLDPAKDYLIMLFPQGFWYDATLFCAGLTLALAAILAGVAGDYLLITRKRVIL